MLNRHFVVVCCFLLFSNSLHAELIQWDAFEDGDELAVKDESTGLIWLDLDRTANVHYDEAGSLFDGWGYAKYEYVESLLEDTFFDINISGSIGEQYLFEQSCANTTNCYRSSKDWQELFGATEGFRNYQTHSYGLYRDQQGILRMGGTYLNGTGSANRYGMDFNVNYSVNYDEKFSNDELNYFSTFLIMNDSLPIEIVKSPKLNISVSEPSHIFALVFGCIWMIRRRQAPYKI